MADFTATFEAGVNGNPVTTGAGEASLTAWGSTNNGVYSNTHVAHGTLAAKCPSGLNSNFDWNLASVPDTYGRVYLYMTANSAATNQAIVSSGNASIKLWNDGTLYLDAGPTQNFATHPALNQWVRIEFHIIYSATVGQIEAKLFNSMDSSTPTETQTSPASWNTGASGTSISFKAGSGIGSDVWLDDIVANATSYPGPAAAGGGGTAYQPGFRFAF